MKSIRNILLAAGALSFGLSLSASAAITELPTPGVAIGGGNINNGYVRTMADRERDKWQHPMMMVVQFGGGTRRSTLLELMATDHYWAGEFAVATPLGRFIQTADQNDKAAWDQRVKEKEFREWHNDAHYDLVPLNFDNLTAPNSVDIVLMSRKMGKLMADGNLQKALAGAKKTLKVGGVLLVEDYRGATDKSQDPKAANGRIREDYAIAEIEKAGFTLNEKEDNLLANPKDARTGNPTNDSDRFLLKFNKWNR